MQNKHLFLVLLILGTVFWGISFPVTKLSIGSFSPSTFLFYRFSLAALSVSLIFGNHLKYIDYAVIKSGICLALPLTFAMHFQTLGLVKHTSASQCAFVAGMSVVIIPFIKVFFYKSHIDIRVWIAAIVALLGLFVISINDDLIIDIGDAYVLLGTIGFAYYLIQVEQYVRKKNIIPTLAPMFGSAAIIMFFLSLSNSSSDWLPESNTFWSGIVYCALFSTAYMYSVSNISQKYISSEKVAIIFLFDPIFAAIASYFIIGESITWRLLCGGCLILIATLITEIKVKHYRVIRKSIENE